MFDRKVIVVTGGGSGIGASIAKSFAAKGGRVAVLDWNEEEGRRVSAEMNALYHPALASLAIKTDVSIESEVREAIEHIVRTFGRIDVLVNNAATILPKRLEEITEAEWDRLQSINLKSVFLMIKHSINELRKTRGSIVNMASLNGLVGQRQNPAYAASKGGIVAMTKALALDYAEDGVRVNCICPAGVLTPLLKTWIDQQDDPAETEQSLKRMHPLGRIASAEDIAQAALYLAGPESSFITGVALPVDGGASLGY